MSELPNGTMLQEYKVIDQLGRGGFGITYLAKDINLGNKVAIKEYMPDFAIRVNEKVIPQDKYSADDYTWGLKQFLQEGQTLVRFSSDYIVSVKRFFQQNNTAYLVMEYIDGRTLQDFVAKITNPTQIENLFFKVCEGLSQVHGAKFLHRDLKPDNILIRNNGEPVLIDFGSARQANASRTVALFSQAYSPIEQYASKSEHGDFTDIYSLAATFYHVITNNLLADSPTRVLNEDYEALEGNENFSSFSNSFRQLIDAGLRVRPDDRPQSISEWLSLNHHSTKEKQSSPTKLDEVDEVDEVDGAINPDGGVDDNLGDPEAKTSTEKHDAYDKNKFATIALLVVTSCALVVAYEALVPEPSPPSISSTSASESPSIASIDVVKKPSNSLTSISASLERSITETEEVAVLNEDSNQFIVSINDREWEPALANAPSPVHYSADSKIMFSGDSAFRIKANGKLAIAKEDSDGIYNLKWSDNIFLKSISGDQDIAVTIQ